jgi:cob(I)alamin adenosyltransferase
VLLDEINVALQLGYLDVDMVLKGLSPKLSTTHVILTGGGAPLDRKGRFGDVNDLTLIKHPFKKQGIRD